MAMGVLATMLCYGKGSGANTISFTVTNGTQTSGGVTGTGYCSVPNTFGSNTAFGSVSPASLTNALGFSVSTSYPITQLYYYTNGTTLTLYLIFTGNPGLTFAKSMTVGGVTYFIGSATQSTPGGNLWLSWTGPASTPFTGTTTKVVFNN